MADGEVTKNVVMVGPDQPLIAVVGCFRCGVGICKVGIVVPGFHYPCPSCNKRVEKGLVIACPECNTQSCADCVYQAFVRRQQGN